VALTAVQSEVKVKSDHHKNIIMTSIASGKKIVLSWCKVHNKLFGQVLCTQEIWICINNTIKKIFETWLTKKLGTYQASKSSVKHKIPSFNLFTRKIYFPTYSHLKEHQTTTTA
jgi:hypothetical protein